MRIVSGLFRATESTWECESWESRYKNILTSSAFSMI